MRIRTPADLGALIRDHRTRLGLDQKSLAQKVGVSRQWMVDAEKGTARAEIGLLLRTVGEFAMDLPAGFAPSVRSTSPSMQIKKVRENRRTPTCLTVRMRTWILIPSLTPHAGKENDRRRPHPSRH